jgi:hypothetical protein
VGFEAELWWGFEEELQLAFDFHWPLPIEWANGFPREFAAESARAIETKFGLVSGFRSAFGTGEARWAAPHMRLPSWRTKRGLSC